MDARIKGYDYTSFKVHPYVQYRKSLYDKFGNPFDIDIDEKVVALNDYGKSFAKVCLGKEV